MGPHPSTEDPAPFHNRADVTIKDGNKITYSHEMRLSIKIYEGEPDSVMPLGANVVQLFVGFEGPPQLSEPHDAEPDGLGADAAGVGPSP